MTQTAHPAYVPRIRLRRCEPAACPPGGRARHAGDHGSGRPTAPGGRFTRVAPVKAGLRERPRTTQTKPWRPAARAMMTVGPGGASGPVGITAVADRVDL